MNIGIVFDNFSYCKTLQNELIQFGEYKLLPLPMNFEKSDSLLTKENNKLKYKDNEVDKIIVYLHYNESKRIDNLGFEWLNKLRIRGFFTGVVLLSWCSLDYIRYESSKLNIFLFNELTTQNTYSSEHIQLPTTIDNLVISLNNLKDIEKTLYKRSYGESLKQFINFSYFHNKNFNNIKKKINTLCEIDLIKNSDIYQSLNYIQSTINNYSNTEQILAIINKKIEDKYNV